MKSCEITEVGWTASRGASVGAAAAAVLAEITPVTVMVSTGTVCAKAAAGNAIIALESSRMLRPERPALPLVDLMVTDVGL